LKALIQSDYGDPAKVLKLCEVAEPNLEEGQVVLEMEAAVVHAADAHTVLGADGFRKKLPRTPGYEGVGRIIATSAGVEGLSVGMRVFAPIGSGTYRERLAVDAQDLMPAPDGDAVQVALLSLSPASALLMLQDFATLAPDDWLIQNAANSAIGRMVIQLATDLKLRLINVVKSSPVIGELKEIGAGAVLLDTEDLRDRVTAVTQGAPVKLALDAVGGAATARLASCLGDDATLVNYGAMSGEPCHMPADLIARTGIRMCGFNPSRQLARHTPEERKAVYARIGELVANGRLLARLAATYPLESAVEALSHALRTGDKRFGKVVLRVKQAEAAPAAASAPDAQAVADAALLESPIPPQAAREGAPQAESQAEESQIASAETAAA